MFIMLIKDIQKEQLLMFNTIKILNVLIKNRCIVSEANVSKQMSAAFQPRAGCVFLELILKIITIISFGYI